MLHVPFLQGALAGASLVSTVFWLTPPMHTGRWQSAATSAPGVGGSRDDKSRCAEGPMSACPFIVGLTRAEQAVRGAHPLRQFARYAGLDPGSCLRRIGGFGLQPRAQKGDRRHETPAGDQRACCDGQGSPAELANQRRWRALRELEEAGLIRVEARPRKSPIVTILIG
jgi:hypothetical protein